MIFKFLKKRKAAKIQKLLSRIVELEDENATLKRKVFYHSLKNGEVKISPRRRVAKLMGNTGGTKYRKGVRYR